MTRPDALFRCGRTVKLNENLGGNFFTYIAQPLGFDSDSWSNSKVRVCPREFKRLYDSLAGVRLSE
jgi:hypothetical protein